MLAFDQKQMIKMMEDQNRAIEYHQSKTADKGVDAIADGDEQSFANRRVSLGTRTAASLISNQGQRDSNPGL